MTPRIKELFSNEIRPNLKKEFGYNVMNDFFSGGV